MTLLATRVVLAVAIVGCGLTVRLVRFGEIPVGFHQDEAGTAYDAFALLHYGVDRHGISYPLVLPGFGSGTNALPAYWQVPFQALVGTTVTGARTGALVALVLSACCFAWLAGRLRGPTFGLLAGALVAIAPWHVLVSRWALDENLFPAVFVVGVLLQVIGTRRPVCLLAAAVCFGASAYTHGTAYFVVPAYVALSGAYLLYAMGPRPMLLAALAVVVALTLPLAAFLVVNTFQLDSVAIGPFTIPRLPGVPRFSTVASVFNDPITQLPDHLRGIGRVLILQRDWNVFSAVPGFGLIYYTSMPFVVWGVWRAVRDARVRVGSEVVMLVWLCVGLALSLLLVANVNRVNVLMYPLIYFLARGVEGLLAHRRVFLVLCAVYATQFAGFTYSYFGAHQQQLAPAFFASYDQAIRGTAGARGVICSTDHGMNMPYVFVLFHERIDPRLFARTVVYENPGEEFQSVRSFGRHVFGLRHCPLNRADAFIGRTDDPFLARFDPAVWTMADIGNGFLVGRRRID